MFKMTPAIKSQLIADGICGSAQAMYSNAHVFWYTFIDYILLSIQKPGVVAVYDAEGRHLRSSVLDPDLLQSSVCKDLAWAHSRFRPILWERGGNRLQIVVGRIEGSGKNVCIHTLNGQDHDVVNRVFQLLPHFVCDKIVAALPARPESLTGNRSDTRPSGQDDLDVIDVPSDVLDHVRRAIDNVFTDFLDTDLLHTGRNRGKLPNLFPVVRTRRVGPPRQRYYDYDLRLLLPSRYKECLRNDDGLRHSYHGGVEALLTNVETPLGNVRSIADSVFWNGTVDFSYERVRLGRDNRGTINQPDQRRQDAEELIFRSILAADRQKTFYLPIHISGIPWMALLMLADSEQMPDKWKDYYYLYRTLVPELAPQLRAHMRETYRCAIVDVFAQELGSSRAPHDVVTVINERWAMLWRAFPYPALRLEPMAHPRDKLYTTPDPMTVRLPGDLGTFTVTVDVTAVVSQVAHDQWSDGQQIVDECRRVVERVEHFAGQRLVELHGAYRHTITNSMPQPLAIQVIQEYMKRQEFEKVHKKLEALGRQTELLDAAVRVFFDRSIPDSLRGRATLRNTLAWLCNMTPQHDPCTMTHMEGPDVELSEATFADVFTVLWNIWHNASKRGAIKMELSQKSNHLFVGITSVGSMDAMWKRYLLETGAPLPPSIDRITGLQLTKEALSRLDPTWRLIDVVDTGDHTTIQIAVHTIKGM